MGDITENTLFVKFVIFWSVLTALIILLPFDFETTAGSQDIIDTETDFIGSITSSVNNFFTELTGLPTIINTIIFAPFLVIALYLLIRLLVYVLPFVGD